MTKKPLIVQKNESFIEKDLKILDQLEVRKSRNIIKRANTED